MCVGMQCADTRKRTMNADWLATVPSIPPAFILGGVSDWKYHKQQAPLNIFCPGSTYNTGHVVDTSIISAVQSEVTHSSLLFF